MTNFRLNEAIARARDNGKRVKKKDLAALLWPESSLENQRSNIVGLARGIRRVKPEWVRIICEQTGVTADFLFGLTN